MDKEDAIQLGWENICPKKCYDHLSHAHQFAIGQHIQKTCVQCGNEMNPYAQIYETKPDQNKAVLYNAYICKQCLYEDNYVLYDGLPKAYSKIYAEALRNINSS